MIQNEKLVRIQVDTTVFRLSIFNHGRDDNMSSQLKEAIIKRDENAIKEILSSLDHKDNWSLITIIDELIPMMLMESNLRYGNFHIVKMNLFLRKLALEGYFSKATEKKLVYLIANEMAKREWIVISAEKMGYTKRNTDPPIENLIEQMDRDNIHNLHQYRMGACFI